MAQPWTPDFATNYQERGNYSKSQPTQPSYPNPYLYPSSPTTGQPPDYNRSPAPFHPVQSPTSTQPAVNGYPASSPQQPYYQQQQQQQQPPQQQQYYQQSSTSSTQQYLDQQVLDRREQPDMDEDFPSYKDIRNVFLQKQQEAAAEESRSNTIPRRRTSQTTSYQSTQTTSGKKPPPTPARKPTTTTNIVVQSQQSRTPGMSQTDGFQQQPSYAPPSPTTRSTMKITSHARQNNYNPPEPHIISQPASSTYTEIPVQHVTTRREKTTQIHGARQPGRVEMGYRPPMSINVSSPHSGGFDSPSPRVRITSNSPMSPQRAWYRPDSSDMDSMIIPRRTDRRHSVSFAPMVMSSAANQPRRRTSYAEIIMSSPQTPTNVPRQLTASSPGLVQRSYTTVTTNRVVNGGAPEVEQEETFPTFSEVKSQFSRQESQDMSQGYREPFGVTHSTKPGLARIRLRKSAPPGGAQSDMYQRQAPGWSATVQTGNAYSQPAIRTGPNVQYTPSANQPGFQPTSMF